ncbi:MAG: hypothetical protein ACYTGS_05730, partial [Planctomycetota bacterium]
ITIITHDVLIQHLRVRPGNKGPVDADINDAVSMLGQRGGPDGISASWGEDETISTWYGAHDITISWSIISEALNRSRHRKKTHSAGLLIGDSSYNVSVHHNLLAHNDFRNPLISEGGTHLQLGSAAGRDNRLRLKHVLELCRQLLHRGPFDQSRPVRDPFPGR